MSETAAVWIKDPMAILADGAERGIVVADGAIVELVGKGREPKTVAKTFEARDHVVVPGLINTHHHFYQTLTRAVPAALDRELFPWLKALYPIWAKMTPEALDAAVTVAMAELMLSGCTHHDRTTIMSFRRGLEDGIDIEIAAAERLGLRVLADARLDEFVGARRRLAADSVVQDETRSWPTASGWSTAITSAAKRR
ncbi:MAG: amidohydrolase family protein [Pseudolabrys sp.]